MITRKQIYDFVASMKPHAMTAFKENQKEKLPIIINDSGEFFDTDGILHSEKCKIAPVKKYHYRENWYYYKYSVDRPDETFGILKVENLPYKSFYKDCICEKQSFIASMDKMINLNFVVPFMLFIDNRFVNWNDIDVVYDCGKTYLLLHGEKYNWQNLFAAKEFKIIVLPFKVEYIGTQTDESFNLNLAALTDYLQKSMEVRDNKAYIDVPAIGIDHEYAYSVYSIGAWLYRQIRMNYLGLLTKEQTERLKKISIIKYEYDEAGNQVGAKSTRFNALDKDVYAQHIYDSLCYMPLSEYEKHKIFTFDNDGYLVPNGVNSFYVLTDRMHHDRFTSTEKIIYNDHFQIKNPLQRENYLAFKNGELFTECEIITGYANLMRIDNKYEDVIDVFTFYHLDADEVYFCTHKFDQLYLKEKYLEYAHLSRTLRDGIKAILLNEDGTDSERIIDRVDALITHKFYNQVQEGFVYINDKYKLLSFILDDENNLTEDYITGVDFGVEFEPTPGERIRNNLIAKRIYDESEVDSSIVRGSIVLTDETTNSIVKLISTTNNMLYAKVLNDDQEQFESVDPSGLPVVFITEDGLKPTITPTGEQVRGKYVVLRDTGDDNRYPAIISNSDMYASIFDRGGETVSKQRQGEFLLIDLSIDYGIAFINKGMVAKSMNEDGTFNGNESTNLTYEDIGDSNIMPLERSFIIDYKDAEINDYTKLCMQYLDFVMSDYIPYLDNVNTAIETLVNYDVTVFNKLYHTNIESDSTTGAEANRNLNIPLGHETRRGLKIPRQKFYNHETYCMVFLNGELLEQYHKMVVYHDFFFIPIEEDYWFDDADEIEFMYFMYCDNNEIQFRLTDKMLVGTVKENIASTTAIIPSRAEDMMNGSMVNYLKDKTLSDAKVRYRFLTIDGVSSSDYVAGVEYVNRIKTDIFSQYIRPEDLKIFEKYPENFLEYSDIIEPSEDLAFNVSFQEDGECFLYPEVITNRHDRFTAVSKRKFIYQRLYVESKSYRIKLGKRFRYCDNQKQYMLFINGRRIYEESFFITTPKYSRPFWGTYLYLTKFVTPEDRVEIFYVPEEMKNTNVGNPVKLRENGYIQADKTTLDVPYDSRLYMFFINGKKINPNNLFSVSSNILRVSKDTKTLMPLVINKVYTDTIPEVVDYMSDPNRVSIYDGIIDLIANRTTYLGKDELDRLFGIYVQMSDVERNMLKQNIGRIAVINEIVRDFWVSSGYPYHEKPFVYDYDLDEIIYQDKDGNYIMPALDANWKLNIKKNDTHLLYFTADPEIRLCEKGSVLELLNFIWDYSVSLYNDNLNLELFSQTINGIEIGTDARSYGWVGPITENMNFLFTGNTGYKLLQDTYSVKFVNPIYYGVINESMFKHYRLNSIISIDELIALIPKNGRIPSDIEMLTHMETPYILEDLRRDYRIVRNLTLYNERFWAGNYVFLKDLTAIVPNNWKDLINGLLDVISEDRFEDILRRYKHYDFNDYLLVDPNEEPIEFVKWIKAIIPADEKEVMGYPDRLKSRDGIILLDDNIDPVFAMTMRKDGRFTGPRISKLHTVDYEFRWDFFEFTDYMVAIKMNPDGVLLQDTIEDLSFVNTPKDVIKGYTRLTHEDQEWSTLKFLDFLGIVSEKQRNGFMQDSVGHLTFGNTDMSKIPDLGFKKELPPPGLTLIDDLVGFLLDAQGRETTRRMSMSGYSYRDGGFDTDREVGLRPSLIETGMLMGMPSDVDVDEIMEGMLYAKVIGEDDEEVGMIFDILPELRKTGHITLGTVDYSSVIALTMNEKGEFLKDLIAPPKDKELFFYLGKDNKDETMIALADPEKYDRSANRTKTTEFIGEGFDIYAMLMDESYRYSGNDIHGLFDTDYRNANDNAWILNDSIYARVIDNEGYETGKTIDLFDYIGGKHPTEPERPRQYREIWLEECLWADTDNDETALFLNTLTAVLSTSEVLMSNLLEQKSTEESMATLMKRFKCVPGDFMLMNNNEEPLWLLNHMMAIIPNDVKDVMGYPERLTAAEGVVLMDDNIDSVYAIAMDDGGRPTKQIFYKIDAYEGLLTISKERSSNQDEFLQRSIYDNIVDSEETVVDKLNSLSGKQVYLDNIDKSNRIIYFDDYMLLDLNINDAIYTKYLTAILADGTSLLLNTIERTYDKNTLSDIAEAYRTIAGDFLMTDIGEYPLEYLEWLSAIAPLDYNELMMTEESDPEILLKHLNGLNLSEGMIYNPSTGSIDRHSGFMAILLNEDGSVSDKIIHDIGLTNKDPDVKLVFPIGDVVNVDDLDLYALFEDGRKVYSRFNILDVSSEEDTISNRELNSMIAHIDKHLHETPDMDITYPIGNNNYFLYAVPKHFVYNQDMERMLDFTWQDLTDRDLLSHTLDRSSPLYTSGVRDEFNHYDQLDKIGMRYMGETDFTSEYGITERYVVWRTNGFFTRIHEDYGVRFQVQSVA